MKHDQTIRWTLAASALFAGAGASAQPDPYYDANGEPAAITRGVKAPTALRLENARVTVVGDKIFLTRVPVPVTTPSGVTLTARDAQLTLKYNGSTGVVIGASLDTEGASPSATPQFQPGRYKNPVNNCEITVSNPVVGSGGRQTYTVNSDPAKCGTTLTANVQLQFTTGAIAGHPNASLFTNSGCTFESPERAYGVGLSGSRDNINAGELTYATDGPSSLTLNGLNSGGNSSCSVNSGENFNYCGPSGICS